MNEETVLIVVPTTISDCASFDRLFYRRGEIARDIGRYGSKGVSKAVIIGGVPPYLVKAADNPEGVDGKVYEGIEKAIKADRYTFFPEFCKNFYNSDVFFGKRVSEAAVQATFNLAASASSVASLACVPPWIEDFRNDLAKIDVPTLIIPRRSRPHCPLQRRWTANRLAGERRAPRGH